MEKLIEKLQRYTVQDFEAELLIIVDKHSNKALALNKLQLFSGRDSLGGFLEEYKSERYAKFKLSLNPEGVRDLRLNGNFYEGFYLEATEFPIFIDSTDFKTKFLTKANGEDIFGLDPDNLDLFRQELLPDIQEAFRKAIGL